jgi:hypothetical protein
VRKIPHPQSGWGIMSGAQFARSQRRQRRQPQKGGSEQIGVKARACKRLADANVPFCGKEEQGSGRMFCLKSKTEQSELCSDALAAELGFEPRQYESES